MISTIVLNLYGIREKKTETEKFNGLGKREQVGRELRTVYCKNETYRNETRR